MPKLRRVLGGALLTAAATALTVKGALTSPIGALVPTDQLQHDLRAAKDATLTQSKTVLTQAQQRLVAAIVRAPSEASPSAAPASDGQVAAAESKAREDPEPSVRGAAHVNAHRILRAAALMQVEPATAQEAGPALLGRVVDVTDPYDNADVGTAVLKEDVDAFHDLTMALAAYYQGPTSLRENGMFPETQQYVQGILDLAARMNP